MAEFIEVTCCVQPRFVNIANITNIERLTHESKDDGCRIHFSGGDYSSHDFVVDESYAEVKQLILSVGEAQPKDK